MEKSYFEKNFYLTSYYLSASSFPSLETDPKFIKLIKHVSNIVTPIFAVFPLIADLVTLSFSQFCLVIEGPGEIVYCLRSLNVFKKRGELVLNGKKLSQQEFVELINNNLEPKEIVQFLRNLNSGEIPETYRLSINLETLRKKFHSWFILQKVEELASPSRVHAPAPLLDESDITFLVQRNWISPDIQELLTKVRTLYEESIDREYYWYDGETAYHGGNLSPQSEVEKNHREEVHAIEQQFRKEKFLKLQREFSNNSAHAPFLFLGQIQ